MKVGFAVALVSFLTVCPRPAFAWSASGHEVIAAIAWCKLPVDTKKKVFELLKSHPEFPKWQESFEGDSGSVDLPTFVFLKASRWPDEIRRRGNKHDHPHWHYVDWELKPPSFPKTEEPAPTDNVIYGIAQSEKTLVDKSASPEDRAAALSWLEHLCGDIAQPLHCVSLFDEVHPSGDKGGNSFFVKPASRGVNLHSLWDGALGTSGKPQAHVNEAIRIAKEHPGKSLFELNHRRPEDWSLEGRALAIEKAYLHGNLKGGTNAESAAELPPGYTKEMKQVAEKQAALAGYRLADEIRMFVR